MGRSSYFYHHRLLKAAKMFSADFSQTVSAYGYQAKKRAFIVTRQL